MGNPSPKTRKLAAPIALMPNGKFARNIILAFNTEGTLKSIQTDVKAIDSLAEVEYYNGILIPSMTNTHCHLEHPSNQTISQSIQKLNVQDKLMWAYGIGAVGDTSNDDLSLDYKTASQIHYQTVTEYHTSCDIIGRSIKVDLLQYNSNINRLIENLPGTISLTLVHCANIDKQNAQPILEHFEDVTFVLCPRSDQNIEHSFETAAMLRDLRANIALGTDSLNSRSSLNLISEVEWLMQNNPNLTADEVLTWATLGGAKALGIQDKLGTFTVGTQCGAVLVEGFDLRTLKPARELRSQRLV